MAIALANVISFHESLLIDRGQTLCMNTLSQSTTVEQKVASRILAGIRLKTRTYSYLQINLWLCVCMFLSTSKIMGFIDNLCNLKGKNGVLA